jgi:2-dehydro-3-deoxygluconokinase
MIHAETNFPDDVQQCLDYSLAAAVLKYSIPGDFNLSTEDEIRQLMRGDE